MLDVEILIDKIEMLFTDVETKGKKQGYERAAKEYAPIYEKIANEYKKTKELFVKQKNVYGNQALELNKKLKSLEKQRKLLENQMASISNDVAKKYNIPRDQFTRTSCRPSIVFDWDYFYKKMKLLKAEQQGYIEAKKLYEEKIQKLQDDLYRCKKKGNGEKELLHNTILQILDEICKEEMRIAELRILLKE